MDLESDIRSQLELLAELWITEVEPAPREYSTSENRWVHVAERAWCDAAGRHPWEEPPGWAKEVREAIKAKGTWDACVYIFRNADDEIVYIGQTCNLPNRLSAHAQRYRDEVTSIRVRPCKDRQQALALEAILIRERNPRDNVQGALR